MLYCGNYSLEKWRPNFSSSGQASPEWSRITCSGIELCNSLDWLDWPENPVQVQLCDACGTPGCSSGRYVHISELGDFLLWTKPHINESDDWEATQYAPAFTVRRASSVLIPKATVQPWRAERGSASSGPCFPKTTRLDLANAWFMKAEGPAKADSIREVVPTLERELLATDTLDQATAISKVRTVIKWFTEAPMEELKGELKHPPADLRVETFYFDGPSEEDWPAFAYDRDVAFPAFGKNWVYVYHPTELQSKA